MRVCLASCLLLLFLAPTLAGQPLDSLRELFAPALESADGEESPVLAPDGNTLWFLRRGNPRNMGAAEQADVWVSYRVGANRWTKAVNLGPPVNSRDDNRVLAVHPSGNRLYLRHRDSLGRSRILYSDKIGRLWSTPYRLPMADTVRLGEHSSISLGPDGDVMIISQTHPEDPDRYDLYYSTRDPWGVWVRPVSLGDSVNTGGQERKVHLAADGKTLYFSSNGRGGAGGTDIFHTKRTDDSWRSWTEPVPLGPSFSTAGDDDDFTLAAAGEYVLVSSPGPEGDLSLFRVPLPDSLAPDPICLVEGNLPAGGGFHPDSCRLLYFPGDATPAASRVVPVSRSGRFSAIVSHASGRGLLLFAYPGYFPQTFQLPDTTVAGQALDRETRQLMDHLRADRAYRNREEDIIGIYRRLAEVEKEIIALEGTLNRLGQPSPEWWPVPDSALLAGADLQEIKEKYRPHLELGQEPDSLAQPAGPNDTVPDVATRLQRVRGRFLRTRRAPATVPGEDLETETSADPGPDGPDFSVLVQRYWQRKLRREGPALRYALEQRMLEDILVAEREEKRPDATKIRALEARLATVLERMEDIAGRPAQPRPPAPAWLDSLRHDLDQVLDEPMQSQWEAALRPRLEESFEGYRRKFNRNQQRQNLEQDLEDLLTQQIEVEREAMETVPPDSPQEGGRRSPSPPAYREAEVHLSPTPFAVGQRHVARSVGFFANTATLMPNAVHELDLLVDLLTENPDLGAALSCHTHGQMTHIKAQSITKSRARTLSDYFSQRGIAASRLTVEGVGKLDPLTAGDGPRDRRLDQRVEVRIFLAAR